MKHVAILKSRMDGAKGGLEKYTSRIASAFVEKGLRVSLLTAGSPPSPLSGVSSYSVKTATWPPFLKMEQYDRFTQKWLQENKTDLIFGMDRNRMQTHLRAGNGVHAAFLDSRIAAEGKWKRLVCSLNPMHRKILEIEKQGFENPLLQKLFTNSFMVRDQILSRYSVDPAKIQVIHNGVEWQEMESDFKNWEAGRSAALSQWGLDPSRFHFLFIGNGYMRKGLDKLLESLAALPMRDFHLSVVGKDKRIEAYKNKTRSLGLEAHVRFFGPQHKIRPFYQFADALVIPSFYDPFANVTVEALAMGLFVISSKQNGGHEILTPENGHVIGDLLNTDSLLHSLNTALQNRKTEASASKIRKSVEALDFSKQMKTLIDACGLVP